MAVGAAQLCLGLLRCASLVAVCREVLALKGFRGTRAFKVTAAAIGALQRGAQPPSPLCREGNAP